MKPLRVAVIGAGTMGHGIAYVAALAGCEVQLTDARADALPQALDRIEALAAGGAKRGKVMTGRVEIVSEIREAVSHADIVIEAVAEDLAIKQRLFVEVERAAPDVMKLVEVVTHGRDNRPAVERAVEFARQVGKEPIVVRDSPGFASSRLGVVLGLEAMRMLEQGVASAEDIDKAMELGYNHPMGPLKLTDLVGLDVRLAIAEYLHATLGKPHYEPPKILRDKVKKGELGRKTGKGFYTWSD